VGRPRENSAVIIRYPPKSPRSVSRVDRHDQAERIVCAIETMFTWV
jgi:hypothetical protein